MDRPAAFSAVFTDWKLIRGRKVVQIVLELPIEQADAAYQALGGMPNPAESVWCGVARLVQGGERAVAEQQPAAAPNRPRAKRSFDELPLSQQAALICGQSAYWKFLGMLDEAGATEKLRNILGVKSRAELDNNDSKAEGFVRHRDRYLAWKAAGI